MAFDPDKFLASAPAPGGFNPDAWLASNPPPKQEPGALEALGRGALQGASLGFSDEISGALTSLFSDKTYAQARDESRAANAAAQAAHPNFYGGGELGGSIATAFVPGLNVAKGASLANVAAKGAIGGALAGLGGSEANDAAGLAKDTAEGAAVGGAGGALFHGISSKLGSLLDRAPEMQNEQTLKALAQGEGKAGAAWSKTRGLVKDTGIADVVNEKAPFEGKSLSIADIANKPAEEVRPVVKARLADIGGQLDTVYDKADKSSGGVKLSDLIKHYDDQIAELKTSPGNQPFVKALEDTKADVLQSWGSRPKFDPEAIVQGGPMKGKPAGEALEILERMKEANPEFAESNISRIKDAATTTVADPGTLVPSKDVRAFATTLQDRGSDTVDRLNPGVGSQVKKFLGQTTRDFINGHVENVLGTEDADALRALNKRATSLYRIDDVLADRESKEAAGRISSRGVANTLLGHGGLVGAGIMAAHGNIPGAVASLALPKVIEKAPAVGRLATRNLASANALLSRIAQAADQGNPWAARQLQILRSTPLGAARLAALQTVAPGTPNVDQVSNQ